MVLMVSVVLVGYKQMSDINRSMELIVNKYNAKTAYITTMYAAARERSISLMRMLDMTDPFDRDEEYIRFNSLATKFAVARLAMNKLEFDEKEVEYSSEQFKLTQAAMPLLDTVVDLLFNDRTAEAKRLLLDKAIPAQDRVLEQLSSMLEYQELAAKRSLKTANISYHQTVMKIGLLALGALVIGLSIAWIVIKYASRANDALFAQVTLKSIGDAVITTDAEGNINYLNPPAEQMTGWTFEKAKGKNIIDVFYLTQDSGARNHNLYVQKAVHSEQPLTMINQSKLRNIRGKTIAIDFSVTPIKDRNEKRIGTALTFRNMNKEYELRNQLSYQASHDALTGLINRYEFEKRLEELIDASIEEDSVHALFYVDLDEFKVVNDTCGHAAGDELLRQLASLLHKQVRSHDTIARLGGDEFGILLSDCKSGKAVKLATKILYAIQDFHFVWEETTFKIGASIGVVEINRHSQNIANVLGIADTACYSAKDSGRNRVHVAEANDLEIESRRGEMQWVSKITHAIENNNFELYYQSIVPLEKHAQTDSAIEILLRMKNDEGGLIMPGAFIPAAERYGLMAQLDRWVISHAFGWLSENPELTATLYKCSINLSGHSIGNEHFLDFVKANLAEMNIDPTKVCFEITETAAISNLIKATEFITELNTLGCSFALDDFGSGFSSFAYLKNLPVEFIKIDGMFVRDIAHDSIDQEMVRSITNIAKAMGKQTIAEFVENDAIKKILVGFGVDYVQGYGIAKPQSLETLTLQNMDLTARIMRAR
jgi:diguanylate cyclase (GGDEF)-like protein/PAS domain S-box-containing protein